ncbi:hypothetical protein L4D76_15295 [Photobacterium sagamiensis]|uniref:hypothetical protein n=1 Tax=Photobacterium sagamiensis TaxID=2910241 RepID=UPI003D107955
MELKQDTKCYTDVCVNGFWYHYDHCGTKVYILRGGASPEIQLATEPKTEGELIIMLENIS